MPKAIPRYCEVCGRRMRKYAKRFCKKCYKSRLTIIYKEKNKERYRRNKEAIYAKHLAYKRDPKNKKKLEVARKKWRWRLKLETLKAYGGVCRCCGEDEPKFLTLDHGNKDGNKHRTTYGYKSSKHVTGVVFYAKLKKEGFPKDIGLSVMCFNCHFAEDHYGQCPHQIKED